MQYAALLRGIGPGNPNMRNEKLREVFENLGFKNVRTVISSGNVLFESDSSNIKNLEEKIEQAIPHQLGFNSTTIIRSSDSLQKLVDSDPIKGLDHGPSSYLLVTFFKNLAKIDFKLPYQPPNKPYKIIGGNKDVLFTVTDNTDIPTTDLMTWMEKQFGKEITSRTYKTVNRILDKLKTEKV